MRISIVAVAAILGLAAGVAPASAAPQVLMVVTPTDTLPMNCEGGVC